MKLGEGNAKVKEEEIDVTNFVHFFEAHSNSILGVCKRTRNLSTFRGFQTAPVIDSGSVAPAARLQKRSRALIFTNL